jgi:quinol monooxygenase YgiN
MGRLSIVWRITAKIGNNRAMNNSGLNVFARFRAKVGQEGRVRRTLLDMIEPTVRESANIGYALYAAKDDPTLLLLYEQWEDMAGLEAHMAQPYFAEMRRRLDGALVEPPEVITSTMIGGSTAQSSAETPVKS